MARTTTEIWRYRDPELATRSVVGDDVEARDGSIGKIDDATFDIGSAHVIVDTGPWIFGTKVMLPAGVVMRVDHDDEKVFVNRTKDQIKNAPEFGDDLAADKSYRGRLASYYGAGGPGYRDWEDRR